MDEHCAIGAQIFADNLLRRRSTPC